MTRAEKMLYLTYTNSRKTFGKSSYPIPSRFIAEIDINCADGFTGRKKNIEQPKPTAPKNPYRQKNYSAPTASQQAKVKEVKTPKAKTDWQIGDRARHKKWGVGTIMDLDGEHITIVFANPEFGQKILSANAAPLEKI